MTTPPVDVPLLSLCMIVRNESAVLARCLDSVRGLADEMVVVDTGSTDGTQEIARGHGARLIQAEWRDDFSWARNLALEAARGRWILVLDADEYLLEKDRRAIATLVRQQPVPPTRAFNLKLRSMAEGGHTGMSAYIVRLFPNLPGARYESPIHEQIAPSLHRAGLALENADIEFIHTGYADPAQNRRKQQRNRAILEKQIAGGQGVTPLTYFLYAGCFLDLGEVEPALAWYGRALAEPGVSPDVAEGAHVRQVSCLVQLQRWSEVVAATSAPYDRAWHPELLLARGQAEVALGHLAEACVWYERVFACQDLPRIPACNLGDLKIEALKYLGEYWYTNGAGARAVALLRAAKALHGQGTDFTAESLAECYRQTPAPQASGAH